MDPKLTSKEVFCAATDVLTLGLTHDRTDDAESILICLRAMRPRIAELDTFEAWILMKRGRFVDASRILANVVESPHGGLQAKALQTYCMFVVNDSRWSDSATQIIENGEDPDAARLMQLLVNPEGAMKEYEEAESAASKAESANRPRQEPIGRDFVRV